MDENMDMKEDKSKEVKSIRIEKAEQGYIYSVEVESKKNDTKSDMPMCMSCETLKYAYSNVDEVLAAVKDDLETAHARMGKKPTLGSGERFKTLSNELEAKGASDPDALAAWIGRKKFGTAKFAKLAAKGRGK